MKGLLARWLGADRPKVIVVFAGTGEEAKRAVKHALSGGSGLPIRVYCEEEGEPFAGCDHFASGAGLGQFCDDLKGFWPALSIVTWTGSPGAAAVRLHAFSRAPFRVLVMNEAGSFFAAEPVMVARHLARRFKDRIVSMARRSAELTVGLAGETASLIHRSGERLRDAVLMAWSLMFRGGQRAADIAGLIWSFAWRTGERALDVVRLAVAALYQVRLRIGERGSGLLLWAEECLIAGLAALAEWFPVPELRLRPSGQRRFRELRPASHSAKNAADFVEVEVRGRGWDRRRLRQAMESEAAFIVMRWKGETADAQPLIDAALAENAFSASRQCAHSAWRPCVLPKHPFRKLQEGEISEVHTPFSYLLVMRRDALVELGCPRACTYGAGLMTIFLQAAAAGWKNLVVGHADPITDEPSMRLEDTELALRVALFGKLLHTQPAAPHLLAGNVARAPGPRLRPPSVNPRAVNPRAVNPRAGKPRAGKPRAGKPRVLVVSPYLPFPLSHGGAVRIYNLCRELSRDVDFVLACFREADETVHYEELHQVFREVHVVDCNRRDPDSSVPRQVAEYRNPAMSSLIHSYCLSHKVDLVQLEYTQMAEYRDDTGGVPVVLVEHDITLTLYRQLAELHGDAELTREYELWRDFERQALQCTNAVWTMSESDRRTAIDYHAPADQTEVVPNGVDLERYQPEPEPVGIPVVLFIGSFRHLPNLLAFEELKLNIMPEVWRERPETILRVVAGPDYERAAALAAKSELLSADSRIVLTGFERDVRPAYRTASVVVIPLPVSAGTNIKLMEAMACGRAVVSTPVGCRGLELLDGQDLLVAETGGAFAKAVLTLIENPALRARVAAHARQTACRRFGWDAVAQVALDSYSTVLGQGVGSEPRRALTTAR